MVQLFFIMLVAGLILIGAEIFVPGGILGAMGAVALLVAIVSGFIAFPAFGAYIALGIVLLVGAVFVLWIKIFPKTSIGRRMTVSNDLSEFKATAAGLDDLVGLEGETMSDLRPSGFAIINGKRVDVITLGGMVSKGDSIRVIDVESNRVVVRRIEQPQQ